MVNNLSADAGDVGSIPGSGRSPGEGNGNPLLYSCLGNPRDRGAWQATYNPWGRKRVRHDLATKQQQEGWVKCPFPDGPITIQFIQDDFFQINPSFK